MITSKFLNFEKEQCNFSWMLDYYAFVVGKGAGTFDEGKGCPTENLGI